MSGGFGMVRAAAVQALQGVQAEPVALEVGRSKGTLHSTPPSIGSDGADVHDAVEESGSGAEREEGVSVG